MSTITVSQAVRAALREFANPESTPNKEVLSRAKKIMESSGGDTSRFHNKSVSEVRRVITDRLGKPLTVKKLEEYESRPEVKRYAKVEVSTPNGNSTHIPKSTAIRMSLLMFPNPEHVPDMDVVEPARKIFQEHGGDPKRIEKIDVAQEKCSLRKFYGRPITHEKIRLKMSSVDSHTTHPVHNVVTGDRQNHKTNKGIGFTNQSIRDVLKQFMDEQLQEPVDRERVVVLARSLMKQRKVKGNVTKDRVRDVLSILRRRCGTPLTAEKIAHYEQHMGDYKKQPKQFGPPTKSTPPVEMDMDNLITCLHDAHHFSTTCGGVDNAITVLHKLKGLQQR